MGGNRTKQQKACDENVLRMKEFRLNFAPAEKIQTSTSNLQWEYSSCPQSGYFTGVARDTFYISNWKWANIKWIMQESWGQRENKQGEVYDVMVRTEKHRCKDNINVWKGVHRHMTHLTRRRLKLCIDTFDTSNTIQKYQDRRMQ